MAAGGLTRKIGTADFFRLLPTAPIHNEEVTEASTHTGQVLREGQDLL